MLAQFVILAKAGRRLPTGLSTRRVVDDSSKTHFIYSGCPPKGDMTIIFGFEILKLRHCHQFVQLSDIFLIYPTKFFNTSRFSGYGVRQLLRRGKMNTDHRYKAPSGSLSCNHNLVTCEDNNFMRISTLRTRHEQRIPEFTVWREPDYRLGRNLELRHPIR